MKNFALIGAAGYIAPRHMKAIRDTGNKLVAAYDPCDSVGILDSYFPEADFFTEFERFDRHLEKLKRSGMSIDYLSICSPNYLHDAHVRYGLRLGANVICEKPIALNPWNVEALEELELEYPGTVFNILQLRLHPKIIELKNKVVNAQKGKIFDVKLNYVTPRGKWYHHSWKGDVHKSGGIATNIGIHFFDLLIWIFGNVKLNTVHEHTKYSASGSLVLDRAEVDWILSIEEAKIPRDLLSQGVRTLRSIVVDGDEIDLSNRFEDLHTLSYRNILSGNGIRISETRASVELVHDIREYRFSK